MPRNYKAEQAQWGRRKRAAERLLSRRGFKETDPTERRLYILHKLLQTMPHATFGIGEIHHMYSLVERECGGREQAEKTIRVTTERF